MIYVFLIVPAENKIAYIVSIRVIEYRFAADWVHLPELGRGIFPVKFIGNPGDGAFGNRGCSNHASTLFFTDMNNFRAGENHDEMWLQVEYFSS